MHPIRFLLASMVLAIAVPAAAEDNARDLDFRYETYQADYRVNQDGSNVATITVGCKILKERAVERAKRYSISFSTSVQKAEVVEAFTTKADGRRIDVPKNNFQVQVNEGRNGDSPLFSDYTTLTVLFPDLAVNDTVRLTYRMTQTEAIFPGHFSESASFQRDEPYGDVRIRIEYPSAMKVWHEQRGMAEGVEEHGAMRAIEWRYSNPQPVKSERHDYSVYDPAADPGFAFSTFESYREIAEAYGVRARPKAAVTERIKKLAEEIAAGKKTPREQAQALYDWVAQNITYGGNCIGVGAVVPHDMDFVLENRMGDCKDHATLLQALLAAKGIASTQALVNATNIYRLQRIPDVSMINHVINYLPDLDLYLDSTAATIPFGLLPMNLFGKPVLLVDGYKEGTTIPPQPTGENRQQMKTVGMIGQDGSITGSTEVSLNGLFAADARAWMSRIPKEAEAEVIEGYFRQQGHVGSGSMEKPDTRELRSSYQYKVAFTVKDFLQRPGTGAVAIGPLAFSVAPVARFAGQAVLPVEQVDSACSSGYSSEEYRLEFPKGMKLLSVPEDVSVANAFLSYRASYKVKGNTLTVRRVFDDRTPGSVCSPDFNNAYRGLAGKALGDLRSPVIYK